MTVLVDGCETTRFLSLTLTISNDVVCQFSKFTSDILIRTCFVGYRVICISYDDVVSRRRYDVQEVFA